MESNSCQMVREQFKRQVLELIRRVGTEQHTLMLPKAGKEKPKKEKDPTEIANIRDQFQRQVHAHLAQNQQLAVDPTTFQEAANVTSPAPPLTPHPIRDLAQQNNTDYHTPSYSYDFVAQQPGCRQQSTAPSQVAIPRQPVQGGVTAVAMPSYVKHIPTIVPGIGPPLVTHAGQTPAPSFGLTQRNPDQGGHIAVAHPKSAIPLVPARILPNDGRQVLGIAQGSATSQSGRRSHTSATLPEKPMGQSSYGRQTLFTMAHPTQQQASQSQQQASVPPTSTQQQPNRGHQVPGVPPGLHVHRPDELANLIMRIPNRLVEAQYGLNPPPPQPNPILPIQGTYDWTLDKLTLDLHYKQYLACRIQGFPDWQRKLIYAIVHYHPLPEGWTPDQKYKFHQQLVKAEFRKQDFFKHVSLHEKPRMATLINLENNARLAAQAGHEYHTAVGHRPNTRLTLCEGEYQRLKAIREREISHYAAVAERVRQGGENQLVDPFMARRLDFGGMVPLRRSTMRSQMARRPEGKATEGFRIAMRVRDLKNEDEMGVV